MKKTLNIASSIICILMLIMSDLTPVLAETGDKAETAAKTVNISVENNEEDPDAGKEEAVETSEKEAENRIREEDGESEKSDNYLLERPDPSEMTEVRIGNFEEWDDFARKCSYDAWSADKYVVLTDNIECNMKKLTPVPYFAGVFDGDGHTINKAAFTEEQNYVGIFSKTAPAAVIRNVNVIGVMKPEGKPFDVGGLVGLNAGMIANCKYDGYVEGYDYIGGIAGYNEATGIISACSVTGKITGLHYVGGICGINAGLVTGCKTAADINTVTKEVQTGLKDIKVEEVFTSLINRGREEGNKRSIASSTNPVDIGGIVGHNIGEISSCTGESTVGYEHVGYNIGGITGRSSGYVHDCTNNGNLNGRKDVGGIVGQAEPYIRLDLTKDIISQLNTSINKLHDSVDKTIKDTDASSGVVSARLNVIKSFADNALSDTGYLANSTTDFVNGVTGATNEIVGRLEYVIDETSANDGPMQDVTEAGEDLKDAAADVEKMADSLDIYNYLSDDEKTEYDAAKTNLKNATDEYSGYYKGKYEQEYRKEYYTALTGAVPPDPLTDDDIKNAEAGKTEQELADAKRTAAERANVTAETYADAQYLANHPTSTGYADDVAGYAETISRIVLKHSDQMEADTKSEGKKAAKDLKDMAGNLRDAGKGMKGILRSVSDSGAVRFPQLSDEYRMRTNSLVANIQGMSDNLGFLNNEMKGSTDVVCSDLEDVNDEFSTIMLLFTDAMDGVLDMDYSELYEDESDDVCETSVDATVANCENYGSIYADINTGGIAGTMAEEYDFDLESDVTGVKDSAKNSTYRTKCVLRQNRNRGDIRGKKSYVGGVCGLHEIGTIIRCANYGKAKSESGDYVGGISGRSYATITASYEKGVLDGGSYIGGIAGSGASVTNCVAMPNIVEGTTFLGAIVGSDDDGAKLRGNIFVSDTLAGADRISRAGQAEPVSYGQLMAMEGIPADFLLMRVDFIVDDKVVSSEQKKIGEVVTPAETPMENDVGVTLASDEYIDWDCDEEIPVYEDMEIKGEIVRYVSSLASEQIRDNKQSVFLVDGRFVQGQSLRVSELSNVPEGAEEYVIDIPDDGQSTHRIRYQMPDDVEKVTVFVAVNDAYEEVECDTYGKYITFDAAGSKVSVRMEENKKPDYKKWCIIGGCIVGAVLVIVLVTVILRTRRRRRVAGSKRKKQDSEA